MNNMTSNWPALLGAFLLLSAVVFWVRRRYFKSKILLFSFGDSQEKRILTSLVDDFQDEFPSIRVELRQFSFIDFHKEVLDAVQRGSGPDVVLMEASHYTRLVFSDILEPLNQYFMNAGFSINGFYPQIVDRFYVDGFLFAIPRDAAPFCLVYYNKRVFDEAGLPYPKDDWTWDGFVETAKKLTVTDASGNTTRWGFMEDFITLDTWIYNANGSYVDNVRRPSRWTFTSDPNNLRGIQFRLDLIHKHKVMPLSAVQLGNTAEEFFVNGKAAMFLGGFWKTPYFRTIKDFQWDVAMIPRNPEGKLNFLVNGSAWGILRTSKDIMSAWKFVSYASSEESSKKLAAYGLTQPALMKIADSPAFLDGSDPLNRRILLDAMKHGQYAPLCRNWIENKELIDSAFIDVWNGTLTVEEAMERLKVVLDKDPPEAYHVKK